MLWCRTHSYQTKPQPANKKLGSELFHLTNQNRGKHKHVLSYFVSIIENDSNARVYEDK